MDSSSTGIETRLPDISGWPLDAIESVDNPTLRRAARRLGWEFAQQPPTHAGFISSVGFVSNISAL